MPAGDEQRDRRVLERFAIEQVGADVSDEVVDGVERLVERDRERLGGADADHEGARETRPARHGDRVELGEAHLSFRERLLDCGAERLEVRSRGDLGHDAAVAGVLVHRRGDDVREQRRAAHDADAGLVAARLDAEHQWRVMPASPLPRESSTA